MSSLDLVIPPGRQGAGRLPASALARIDVALRRRIGGVLPGEHRTFGVGSGTELAQLRPYEPGDDARRIDPAASARTGVLHVRQHVPERSLTTWIVLDISASMAFGTGVRLKSDIAEGVAEVVAQLAVRRGGRVGLVRCGAARLATLPPRGGRGALARLRRAAREGVAHDGATAAPLAAALERVRRLAGAPGLVVVVSDFREAGWERALRSLAARHELVAVEVRDPREAELPAAGQLVVVDPETGRQLEADTSSPALRAAFAAAETARREAVATALRRATAAHVALSTDEDWLRDLARRLR
jgi:uncharacterized protein (DUF58 family)